MKTTTKIGDSILVTFPITIKSITLQIGPMMVILKFKFSTSLNRLNQNM